MRIITPRKAFDRWSNLDNPTFLNPIWEKLGLPEESRLGSESVFGDRKKLHIALSVVSFTPETGVLVRPGLYRFTFDQIGWGCDGYENYVTCAESDNNIEILQDFMKALGLKFREFPTAENSVAFAEKLCQLDLNFKSQFDEYFMFDEIADTSHGLLIQLSATKELQHKLEDELSECNDTIARQQTMLVESRQLLQRVLINQHISECKQLLQNAKPIDKDVVDTKQRYEALLKLVEMRGENKSLRREIAIAKNTYDGARHKARNFHDKELRRIFDLDCAYIDYSYMKLLLSDKSESYGERDY